MKFLKQVGTITVTLLYKLFVSMVDVKMIIGSLTKERKKERKINADFHSGIYNFKYHNKTNY
jgi:hypothetical protein